MNREELDEWFAKADDVLSDWHGGTDAMHGRVPEGDVDLLPPRVDSYYEQPDRPELVVHVYFHDETRRLIGGGARPQGIVAYFDGAQPDFSGWTEIGYTTFDEHVLLDETHEFRTERPPHAVLTASLQGYLHRSTAESPRRRALEARRNRNTGPQPRIGLDGFHR